MELCGTVTSRPGQPTPNTVTQKSTPSWICKKSKRPPSGERRETGEAGERLCYREIRPNQTRIRGLNIVKAVRHRWPAVHSLIIPRYIKWPSVYLSLSLIIYLPAFTSSYPQWHRTLTRLYSTAVFPTVSQVNRTKAIMSIS